LTAAAGSSGSPRSFASSTCLQLQAGCPTTTTPPPPPPHPRIFRSIFRRPRVDRAPARSTRSPCRHPAPAPRLLPAPAPVRPQRRALLLQRESDRKTSHVAAGDCRLFLLLFSPGGHCSALQPAPAASSLPPGQRHQVRAARSAARRSKALNSTSSSENTEAVRWASAHFALLSRTLPPRATAGCLWSPRRATGCPRRGLQCGSTFTFFCYFCLRL
jgi:hypothetical protein